MNRRLIFKTKSAVSLGAICVDQFWLLEARRQGDPARQTPFELEYASDGMGDDVRLIYVEDPIAECAYVIVSGADMGVACDLINEKIPTWTDEELFEDWHNAPHDTAQILAILRIGVAAPFNYAEEFAKHLREGISNRDPAVREAALAAIGYRDWPEFDEELKRIAREDDSERCRNRAAHMLEVSERERDAAHRQRKSNR
jgi:hypothetical protein